MRGGGGGGGEGGAGGGGEEPFGCESRQKKRWEETELIRRAANKSIVGETT